MVSISQNKQVLLPALFVLKDINKDKTELQLVSLVPMYNDSILTLKKESQDIPYIDSLRKRYITATKINEGL